MSDVETFDQAMKAATPRVWVTPVIVAANVVLFGMMLAMGVHPLTPTIESLIRWGANAGPSTTGGEWWRLATCTFIHIGVIHVTMNMVILWDVGRFVERLYGNVGFLTLYLLAGLAGSLASIAWNPQVVSAGASGAVFGCYGGLLAFLLRQRRAVPREVLMRLRKSALLFVGYNVVFGLSVKFVDNAAHLGGLAGGFAVGVVLAHPLTAEGRAGRIRRALTVALAGAALVAGGTRLVPKGVDVLALSQIEQDFLQAAKDFDARKLDQGAFVEKVERDVLPRWRTQLARAKPGSPLEEFMQAEARHWELIAEAVRDDDPAKLEAATKMKTEVERLGKRAFSK